MGVVDPSFYNLKEAALLNPLFKINKKREKTMKKQTLTSKQKLFAHEYLVDSNCTQAAIRAGYSKKTAHSQGSRLLKHVDVKAMISKKMLKIVEKTEMSAERAMLEVKALATSNIMDGMEYDSSTREFSFKAPDEVPAEFWKAAQEVTVYQLPNGGGMATKVKMHPKLQALKMEYDRHKLISPETITNNIASMHVNILDVNSARRRAGRKEIED